MKIACFSTQPHDEEYLSQASQNRPLDWTFYEANLNDKTVALAKGHSAICCFVNDILSASVLSSIHDYGVKGIALRCAGYNNVDLAAAKRFSIDVGRVPAYSPHAVAEHTIALLLTLNRKIHKAYNRVRESNFSLDGLVGFDLHKKVVGVVGTGKIGSVVVDILKGFGCQILAHDPYPSRDDIEYTTIEELLKRSKIVTLHLPLTPESHHLIDEKALQLMPAGSTLLNTSRGALIDTKACIQALKRGHLGGLAIDVYEEEGDLFFRDLSGTGIQDDLFIRLQSFPNVLITGHQGFFTKEALSAIAETTIENLLRIKDGSPPLHSLL